MYEIKKVSDNIVNISLTRGDYFAAYIDMQVEGESYVPLGGTCRFALKKIYKDPDENCLLVIDIPISTLLLEIQPEDTKPFKFGDYVFDIQYTDPDGHPDTFIKGKFTLTEEVI